MNMNMNLQRSILVAAFAAPLSIATVALADDVQGGAKSLEKSAAACAKLPNHAQLRSALNLARQQSNGGFNLDMWATVVNRDGIVCNVAFTGDNRGDQWPGSRVISAQKANTANAFSLPALALSTANLYAAVQPGGSLFGLQHSNPVSTSVAYQGPAGNFGKPNDPLVGAPVGGVNVFGGGLALYNARAELVGAIGVSGDTSCADHNIAWRARHALLLDYVPSGVSEDGDDNINYQGIVPDPSLANDFSHPVCKIAGVDSVSAISAGLSPVREPGT